jgi:hypothetical protein
MAEDRDHLVLKWGALKGWRCCDPKAYAALIRYGDFGMSPGAMQQHHSPEQKQALCDLIDAIDGEITNDWSGELMTKDEAKKYVLEYRT